jgi:hypothetical protein
MAAHYSPFNLLFGIRYISLMLDVRNLGFN